MIYKIIDSPEVLIGGISGLNSYNVYFVKGCLFVSDKNNTCNFYQNIKERFDGAEIIEITEHNLGFEPNHIIDWAKKEFIASDVIRYEKENQDQLNKIMEQLDIVEQELFERGESQCQRKNVNAGDRQKTKNKSILMKLLSRLKCKNNHSNQ